MDSPWGTNDPTEGSRQTISDPWDATADPFTWNGDGSATYNTTEGNNGMAQSNPDGGSDYLNNYRPQATSADFSFPYETSMTPPSKYADASITQLFYTANTYHDVLYILGFDEKAGNFETNNDELTHPHLSEPASLSISSHCFTISDGCSVPRRSGPMWR